MNCPKCNTPTGVSDSRPVSGTVRRRRRCPACAHRFTTLEMLVADADDHNENLAVIAFAKKLSAMSERDRELVHAMALRLLRGPESAPATPDEMEAA